MEIKGTLVAESNKVYWPYNETFDHFYSVPLAGKRAQHFIDDRNQCKGGRWVLVTTEVYDKWYNEVGKHLEFLGHKL